MRPPHCLAPADEIANATGRREQLYVLVLQSGLGGGSGYPVGANSYAQAGQADYLADIMSGLSVGEGRAQVSICDRCGLAQA